MTNVRINLCPACRAWRGEEADCHYCGAALVAIDAAAEQELSVVPETQRRKSGRGARTCARKAESA